MEQSYISRTSGITMKDKIGYAFGDLASCLVFGLTAGILNSFYTDVLKIGVLGTLIIIVAARLWDAINDPIWGRIIQGAKARPDGRYRHWLKVFAVPVAVAAILMFLNVSGFPLWARYVWAAVTYVLFGMLYTCINIPYGSMAQVMTSDDKERSALSVFRSIGSVIGGLPAMLLAMVCYQKVIDEKTGEQLVINDIKITTIKPTVVLIGVCVIALFAVVFFFLCHKMTKERVASHPAPKQKGEAKKVIRALLKSRPFMAVSIASMLLLAAQMFGQGYNLYLFNCYFHKPALNILPAVFQYLPVAVIMFFASKLGNKFGRREVCAYGVLFSAVCYLLLFVLSVFGIRNIWLYLFGCLMGGIGTAFMFLLNWILAADAIDYNRVTYGIDDDATSYAFFTFTRKLGQTVATVLINIPLLIIGYDGGRILYENITTDNLRTMYNASVLIPAVLFLLLFVFLRFVYPLSKKRVDDLQVEKEAFLREQENA